MVLPFQIRCQGDRHIQSIGKALEIVFIITAVVFKASCSHMTIFIFMQYMSIT